MRRSRRGLGGGEFGGSGEDSFVAVVVTKLTGALLFILLLTMVIMALAPKAVDLADGSSPKNRTPGDPPLPLEIRTPDRLPEAIVGRPYVLAPAAVGGVGKPRWTVAGELPKGLKFDPEKGCIEGTPTRATPEPVAITLRVSDDHDTAIATTNLVVYQPSDRLVLPSKFAPALPAIPWRSWMEQGFGFLVLWLAHVVGMNSLANVERWTREKARSAYDDSTSEQARGADERSRRKRFLIYRTALRLGTISAAAILAAFLAWPRG